MNLTFTREQLLQHLNNEIALAEEEELLMINMIGFSSYDEMRAYYKLPIEQQTMNIDTIRLSAYHIRIFDAKATVRRTKKTIEHLADIPSYTYSYAEAKQLGLI